MHITFGPILSRRFGMSLGVDLSPSKKQCNFNCVYCELQAQSPIDSQQSIVPVASVLHAITNALKENSCIDVLTFTANGEPTLYPFLGELIQETKKILLSYKHIKTLILSNGSKFLECKESLQYFDIVKFSLDSISLQKFKRVDKPSKTLDLEQIKYGIKEFAKDFQGDLIAEILIVKGFNDDKESNEKNAEFLREVGIKRLDLSTIDRPSSHRVEGVSNEKLYKLSQIFYGLNVCVATRKNDTTMQIQQQNLDNNGIIELLKRRPLSHLDSEILLTKESRERLEYLQQKGEIQIKNIAGVQFYCL
ncbi:radical SAM protein [Helicobacter didelphidarum]|uniref:Radical SAM protein n=1 Tax=Helicobacter didelphidarum TaxID=2040648 RepID=A0A3D8IFS8_9HELI|nr:radical SAM protein [Helicobacter didelphidarum]RDU64042.1 radical SAM protein [Helicobacter didelphidarum]